MKNLWLLCFAVVGLFALSFSSPGATLAKPKKTKPKKTVVEISKLDVPKSHPRILFKQEDITEIRDKIQREPWASQWSDVSSKAARARRMDPTNPLPSSSLQSRCFALTQALECAAFHALISDESDAAAELSNLLENFDDEVFHSLLPEKDLMPRGEFLEGFATCYDWGYNILTPAARANLERILKRHAGINYAGFINKVTWEATTEANNHSMAGVSAVGLAGLALWHEEADAKRWVSLADQKCKAYFESAFDKDGAAIEGSMYGPFGLSRILPFQAAIVSYGAADIFSEGRLPTICDQLVAEIVPGGSMAVPMNDSDGGYRKWPGVHFLYCATKYQHGVSRWAWEKLLNRRAGNAGHTSPYGVLWESDKTEPAPPTQLLRFCEETGRFVSRTGWGDNDFMLYTEAGKRLNGLHAQGDHGAFLIWSHGGWLACDTGYSNIAEEGNANQTAGHNGILVDGKSQFLVGGGKFSEAETSDFKQFDSAITFTADLAKAYAKDRYNPLKKAVRTYLVMNAPEGVSNYQPYIVLVDHFIKDGKEAEYTFLLHGQKDSEFTYDANTAVHSVGNRALDVHFFPAGKGEVAFSTTDFPSNNFGEHPRMDANWKGTEWQALVVMAPRLGEAPTINLESKERSSKTTLTIYRNGIEDTLEWKFGKQLKVTRKQDGKKIENFTLSLK